MGLFQPSQVSFLNSDRFRPDPWIKGNLGFWIASVADRRLPLLWNAPGVCLNTRLFSTNSHAAAGKKQGYTVLPPPWYSSRGGGEGVHGKSLPGGASVDLTKSVFLVSSHYRNDAPLYAKCLSGGTILNPTIFVRLSVATLLPPTKTHVSRKMYYSSFTGSSSSSVANASSAATP